jgi:hypothetical protein
MINYLGGPDSFLASLNYFYLKEFTFGEVVFD